jgi:branched-subunit amino acid transport protein AzlD
MKVTKCQLLGLLLACCTAVAEVYEESSWIAELLVTHVFQVHEINRESFLSILAVRTDIYCLTDRRINTASLTQIAT